MQGFRTERWLSNRSFSSDCSFQNKQTPISSNNKVLFCNCRHEKSGYDLTAIIEVTAQKGKIAEVERAMSKFPNVCAVYDITGLTDMVIIAKFRNRRELGNFVKRDLALASIERTNSHMVLVTVKENFSFF